MLNGRMNLRIVALLVLLQLLSVYFLWSLDSLSRSSEAAFALLLAVDLVSFSMISYIYRADKRGDTASRGLLLSGCVMVFVLLIASLFV